MITATVLAAHQKEINRKANKIIGGSILVMFAFGLFLSPFYDTWFFALVVGGTNILLYFGTKYLLPEHYIHPYVGSAAYAIFMAQFIYQMHGLFEMHFFAFLGATLLIAYQNWKVQLPNLLIVVVHHALFAWLQYQGNTEIYFTQLSYMDLQTFLFHVVLAGAIIGICAYWSFSLEKQSLAMLGKQVELGRQLELTNRSIEFAKAIGAGQYDENFELDSEEDTLGKALLQMQEGLKKAAENTQKERFVAKGMEDLNHVMQFADLSAAQLADKALQVIAKHLDVHLAAIYLSQVGDETPREEKELEIVACYALNRKKFIRSTIAAGEGLPGQTFLEGEQLIVHNLPKDYHKIESGIGKAQPAYAAFYPLAFEKEIIGVLEVAALEALDNAAERFLEEATQLLAFRLISIQRNEEMKQLLEGKQYQQK